MDRDTEITAWLIIKWTLKFLISPIYCFIDAFLPYTTMFYFLTNIVFFHIWTITFFGWVPMFCECQLHPWSGNSSFNITEVNEQPTHHSISLLMVYQFLALAMALLYAHNPTPLQSFVQMKIGVVLLVLTVSVINGTLFLGSFGFAVEEIRLFFVLASSLLAPFYIVFMNLYCRLYIRLPEEQMPCSGVKPYVVVIGLVHCMLAFVAFQYTPYWPMSIILTFCSFFFSVDAVSLFTTPTYILGEHRQLKKYVVQYPGTIYHVAIRGKHETLPDGFQYHDELQVDQKFFDNGYRVHSYLLSDIL